MPLDVVAVLISLGIEERHRQISRQNVVERRDVRRALYRRMSAQRQDSTTRTTNVSQQHLQDRRRADDLHAVRVLRESERVTDRRRFLRTRRRTHRLGYSQELL